MFHRSKERTADDTLERQGDDRPFEPVEDETRPVRTTQLTDEPQEPGHPEPSDKPDGTELPAVAYNALEERPHPDHPDKVEKPTELKKPSVTMALKRTLTEFSRDDCTDLAAALTYYAVLAVFPAAIALLSLLGVVGEAGKAVDTLVSVLRPFTSAGLLADIEPSLRNLATSQAVGLALVVGVLGALWSASGYVGAFGRAMNRIYEVQEGRPFWKLRPIQVLVTLLAVLLCAVSLVILIVSGPVAESVGRQIGAGDTAVTVWGYAKWPVLAIVVVLVVALLYWATPNVRQPHFRWISVGAFVAIAIWLVASVGFAFYVANFGSYNKTYGAVATGVVALLWLWITNVALLFGAELDSELERSRQLQSGIAAEETLQLPMRDANGVAKADAKYAKQVEQARELRERFTHAGQVEDRPFR